MLARPDRLSLLTTASAVVVATCARDESVAELVANVENALAVKVDMYVSKEKEEQKCPGVVVFPSPSILLTFPNPKVGIDSFVSNTKLAILPTSVHQYHMVLLL